MMTTTFSAESLAKRAAQRGYTLHASVTDERLARIHPRMLNGKPDRLTKQHMTHLDADREQIEQWIEDRCYVASYDLGQPGDEVIAPPTVDESLALVVLPTFRVVAVVEGAGESTDGDETSRTSLRYTILS